MTVIQLAKNTVYLWILLEKNTYRPGFPLTLYSEPTSLTLMQRFCKSDFANQPPNSSHGFAGNQLGVFKARHLSTTTLNTTVGTHVRLWRRLFKIEQIFDLKKKKKKAPTWLPEERAIFQLTYTVEIISLQFLKTVNATLTLQVCASFTSN